MRGGGWYPDRQPRLFRRGMVRWPDATHVLPTPAVEARVMELEPPGCLHLHHENYRDLGHFLEKQLQHALADLYDTDPAAFSFSEYTERAYEILAERRDPRADGDLSHVLSLALAWDVVVRGLIHWDRLSPRPPLEPLAPLPAAAGYAERVRRVFGNLGFR